MTDSIPIEDRVRLLKTIADDTRLRILGLVAEQPRTGKQLAEALNLKPPTISHHMRKLIDAGIVTDERVAQSHSYALNLQLLGSLRGADAGSPTSPVNDRDRILKNFFRNGKLMNIPAARNKRVIVLQYLLEQFDPQRTYVEREVNELLGAFHEDFATLRRELVDYGYLTREKGVYQVATSLPKRSSNLQQELPANEADWLRAVILASVNQE